MLRHVFFAILIWLAATCELGWSTWTNLAIKPAFMQLVVVLAVLFTKPAAVVFWSGVAGLLLCLLQGESLLVILPLFCSVAWGASSVRQSEYKSTSLLRTTLRSLAILTLLIVGKDLLQTLPDVHSLELPQMELVGQVAISFIISVLFCLMSVMAHRRSLWTS